MNSLIQRDIFSSNIPMDLKKLLFLRFLATHSNTFHCSMSFFTKLYIGLTFPYFFDFNPEMQVYKVPKIYFNYIAIRSFLSAIELLSLSKTVSIVNFAANS